MTTFKFSKHALNKHENEIWNAVTIRDAIESNLVSNLEVLEGQTADVICGRVGVDFVGLVVSKERDGVRVIITGFAAPREYWLEV